MTIKECIDIVDNIKPNQYSIKDKVMWLSFLDETIINDVLKTHEGYDGRYDDFTGYTVDDLSVSLVVPSPYDRVYTAYLKMQIDKENGETARYNNSMALYNTYLLEYRKHYNKTHMPLSHDARPGRGVSVKVDVNLSEAEFEAIKRDVYNQLSEDVDEVISPDKLYDIVTSYMLTNIETFKGDAGKTPIKGTDYFTEKEVADIKAGITKDAKGADGYSPLVEIIPIEGGTRVYITDKNGVKSFAILNGADGKTVTNINQLEGADQYLKKLGGRASVDYGEEGIDVNVNAQRSVTLGAEHVNIISEYETTFKANKGEVAADFGNQRITNIADPESEKDGVNKKYVDEALKKISDFEASVPTRTSDIVNDSGFITKSDVPEAPSKVSQLVNDMGYITAADIPPSGGGTSGKVPTKLSELENDVGYLKSEEQYGYIGFASNGRRAFFDAQDNISIVSRSVHIITDGRTFLKSNGDGGVALDVSSQRIANLANPINDTDGANKKYVDDAVNGIPSWAKQPTKPTYTAAEVGAATPAYVDEHLGETIESVKQTTTSTEDGGTNVMTVTLSDGTKSTFSVKNGSKGSKGDKGDTGADGKTPVKGTDYFTNAEKAEFVTAVVAALPKYRAEVE